MSNLYNRDWAKLMVWSNLDTTEPAGNDADFMQAQVAELRRRQEAGEFPDDLDPAYLLIALFAAASASVTLPKVARLISGEDPESEAFAQKYAEQLGRLVQHLRPPQPPTS